MNDSLEEGEKKKQWNRLQLRRFSKINEQFRTSNKNKPTTEYKKLQEIVIATHRKIWTIRVPLCEYGRVFRTAVKSSLLLLLLPMPFSSRLHCRRHSRRRRCSRRHKVFRMWAVNWYHRLDIWPKCENINFWRKWLRKKRSTCTKKTTHFITG